MSAPVCFRCGLGFKFGEPTLYENCAPDAASGGTMLPVHNACSLVQFQLKLNEVQFTEKIDRLTRELAAKDAEIAGLRKDGAIAIFQQKYDDYEKWFMSRERVSLAQIAERETLERNCQWAISVLNAAIDKPVTKPVYKEPTSCCRCDYEEADGSLIEQCPKCKAIDAAIAAKQ